MNTGKLSKTYMDSFDVSFEYIRDVRKAIAKQEGMEVEAIRFRKNNGEGGEVGEDMQVGECFETKTVVYEVLERGGEEEEEEELEEEVLEAVHKAYPFTNTRKCPNWAKAVLFESLNLQDAPDILKHLNRGSSGL